MLPFRSNLAGNGEPGRKSVEDAAHDANLLQGVDADRVADASTIVVAVFSVIIALLFVLFAGKLRAGRNWARTVLTVVTALDVVSILVNGGGASSDTSAS